MNLYLLENSNAYIEDTHLMIVVACDEDEARNIAKTVQHEEWIDPEITKCRCIGVATADIETDFGHGIIYP